MKSTVIFDIDGTLADISHRRAFLDRAKPDWKLFNDSMPFDKPNVPVIELYKTLWQCDKYNLVLCTGRNERYRHITEVWLADNSIPFSDIFMRQDDDYRADYIVKQDFLDEMLRREWKILFSVDDRQQVVDMWRRNGITCLQCAEANF